MHGFIKQNRVGENKLGEKAEEMSRNLSAAFSALVVTAAAFLLFFIPFTYVFALILIMLPLWMIDDAGVIDLGRENNGFFEPNALGYGIAAITFWLLCFLVMRRQQHQDSFDAS